MHSHLLPGIDDGASTMSQAIDMARYAAANGIK
ncbi:MAG: protein-tyrosine phosphatase, partial [Chromatiales bacterium]|nr:protein-tyrosine phosphatase [Chromatiales bacterium]